MQIDNTNAYIRPEIAALVRANPGENVKSGHPGLSHNRDLMGGPGWHADNSDAPMLVDDAHTGSAVIDGSRFLETASRGAELGQSLGKNITDSNQGTAGDAHADVDYDQALASARANRGGIGWERVITEDQGDGSPVEVLRFSEERFAAEYRRGSDPRPELSDGVDAMPPRSGSGNELPEAGPADGGSGDADGSGDSDGGVGAGGAL